jgi:histidine phosphotransferase ChpT
MTDLAHDLAALMCSKLCHDLISPIGALGNGLEVLAEEHNGDLRQNALDLIGASAKAASAKLQFARLAFGTAGGVGGTLDLSMAARAANDYFGTTKARLSWEPKQSSAPKDLVRLCLNLMLVALDCIPRGGEVNASLAPDGEEGFAFTVHASGQGARVPDSIRDAMDGTIRLEDLDARLVQPYFTGHLSRMMGGHLSIAPQGGEIVLKVEHAAGSALQEDLKQFG